MTKSPTAARHSVVAREWLPPLNAQPDLHWASDMVNSAAVALAADSLPDVAMSDALTGTWKAIRRRHPKVPEATISVSSGRGSACGSVAWDTGMPVILVGSDAIDEGPLTVVEYLLHQAAHGLLTTAGGDSADDGKRYPDEQSQGNAGRYHNKSYRDAAQSLGLMAAWTQGGTGWSATTAGDELAMVYQVPVRQIVTATADWQPTPLPRSVRKSGGNGISARCQCQPPRTIRMRGADAAADLREHPVVCSVCGAPFTP